jgi:putative flavoprotein involved in K+ transport
MTDDVLVIGAGPGGLASAYYLERAGISYRVIDKAQVIGSTWANQYPSLRLNTSRFYSHLPELRFPLRYGLFPTGRQYYHHLVKFAERHQFNIHLGVEVYRVAPEDGGWRVESSEGSAIYPAVISATGRFNNPIDPNIPGLDTFKGTVIHSNQFHSPAPFAGRRVLVVGCGRSGTDIAMAIGEISPPALLAIRGGINVLPHYPLRLPRQLWMAIAERLPASLTRRLENGIAGVHYGSLDSPAGHMHETVAYRGPELIHAVRSGWVKPVAEPVSFDGRCVELTDGTRVDVDAVVLATGYYPALSRYLDITYETDHEGWPLRNLDDHPNGREVAGYPGLYLVGVDYDGRGGLHNSGVEARIAVEQIKNRLGISR